MSYMLDHMDLTGKVALVMGSGRGLGRATGLALADAGAHIVTAARRRPEIGSIAHEIQNREPSVERRSPWQGREDLRS